MKNKNLAHVTEFFELLTSDLSVDVDGSFIRDIIPEEIDLSELDPGCILVDYEDDEVIFKLTGHDVLNVRKSSYDWVCGGYRISFFRVSRVHNL